jgi:hypothetical protein
MFRVSLCPSSRAYQLHQQPLVYRRNVLVAVLLVVVVVLTKFEYICLRVLYDMSLWQLKERNWL